MRTSIVFWLIYSLPLISPCQTQTGFSKGRIAPPSAKLYQPTAQRDPQSLRVLDQAVTAIGGLGVVSLMSSAVAQGVATSNGSTKTVNWKIKNGKFRMTADSEVFAGNRNIGWRQDEVGSFKIRPHVWVSNVVPIAVGLYVAEAATDLNFTVEPVADRSNAKQTTLLIRDERTALCHVLCTHYWYFDKQTHLPLALEFQERSLASAGLAFWTTITFADWLTTDGVNIPMNVIYKRLGLPDTVITLNSYQPGASLDDILFDLPEGTRQ